MNDVPAPNSTVSPKVVLLRVTEIMHQIREEIFPTMARRADYVRHLAQSRILLPELESLVEAVRLGAMHVGSMPPIPHTMRGQIGAKLVAIVRRALFWFTPQLHTFHLKVAAALDEQTRVIQALVQDLRELHAEIAELKHHTAQIAKQLELAEPSGTATALKESTWRK
jgi:hypothetical protein